jgi:hypothetical protein
MLEVSHCRTAGGKIMNAAFEKRYDPAPGDAMLRHSHGHVPLLFSRRADGVPSVDVKACDSMEACRYRIDIIMQE